ncbi:hypothetical protein LOTGIDRAFT_142370 [Lottia gigantea]|uniref:TIR domain-containing protein n=1 Tax=Lottia gigantea TaxID=225164 RepID=V4AVF8_LOTGI|nr:hypothetical protein LOTGIDRAFT_142370 [Lottia gigantea]ESO99000.1 hypothetical protein LOTGIDRAFT_142370 [Lottia gigantea]
MCIFSIVTLLLISVVYKYRLAIKYQIYIWRHPRPERGTNFDYDFFVCYSVDDEDWIWDELQPNLEGDEYIKLCIHQRDFKGGKLIVDNIVELMESSRRVLIILSNSFAKSSWCQFELSVAQDLVLDSILEPPTIILLEEIKTEHLSNTLNALINNTTYVPWSNHTDDSSEFWQRLKLAIGNQRMVANTEDV